MDETKTIAWQLIVETKGIEQNTKSAASSLEGLLGVAGRLQAGLLAVVASKVVQEYITLVDTFQQVQNKLRGTVTSAEELAVVQAALATQATNDRVSLQASANMYNDLSDALGGYGQSATSIMGVLDTVQKAIVVSGKSADEAAGEVAHLALALQSGALNQRDVKALRTEITPLGKALADAFGGVPALMQRAKDGTLTTEAVLAKMPEIAANIEGQFGHMGATLKQSFTVFGNGVVELVGQIDDATGASSSFAAVIDGVGQSLNALGIIIGKIHDSFASFSSSVNEAGSTLYDKMPKAIQAIVDSANYWLTLEPRFFASLRDSLKELAAPTPEAKRTADNIKHVAEESQRTVLATKEYVTAMEAMQKQINTLAIDQAGLTRVQDMGTDSAKEAAKSARELTNRLKEEQKAQDEILAAAKTGHPFTPNQQQNIITQHQRVAALTTANEDHKDSLGDSQTAADSYRDSLAQLNAELARTAIDQAALNVESTYAANNQEEAAAATRHLTTTALALLDVEDKRAAAIRAGHPLTEAEVKGLQDKALAEVHAKNATDDGRVALVKANKATMDYATSLATLGNQYQDTLAKQSTLRIEMSQGVDAARHAATVTQALADVQKRADAEALAGNKWTDERLKSERALAEENANLTNSVEDQSQAWALVNGEMQDGLSTQQKAAVQLAKLQRAFELVKGSMSPAQVEAFNEAMKRTAEESSGAWQATRDSLNAFVNDFTDFLTNGAFDFKKFATSLIRDIGRIIIQMEIMQALQSSGLFGKFLGGAAGAGSAGAITPPPGSILVAHGAAFDHGNVVPFESGGVVGSPVTFGLSGGRTGLMGEAGPEAVMPLARMGGGKLGVQGTTPHIQIVNKLGVQASARFSQSAERTSVILEAAEMGAQLAESRMTRSLRSGYGATASTLQRTYGLRRRMG